MPPMHSGIEYISAESLTHRAPGVDWQSNVKSPYMLLSYQPLVCLCYTSQRSPKNSHENTALKRQGHTGCSESDILGSLSGSRCGSHCGSLCGSWSDTRHPLKSRAGIHRVLRGSGRIGTGSLWAPSLHHRTTH